MMTRQMHDMTLENILHDGEGFQFREQRALYLQFVGFDVQAIAMFDKVLAKKHVHKIVLFKEKYFSLLLDYYAPHELEELWKLVTEKDYLPPFHLWKPNKHNALKLQVELYDLGEAI